MLLRRERKAAKTDYPDVRFVPITIHLIREEDYYGSHDPANSFILAHFPSPPTDKKQRLGWRNSDLQMHKDITHTGSLTN
ncbi:hypothetical protein EGR_11013 [Echinococcus granulosus]|uniref:Uncharacterized protein n=1 Tax=Echinococcus granulosus TaxID=6210 RepID=W6U0Y9_ECHGR|nr:hypothetical protein EGR_11013 [Echinococcus granulosus]EUB54126.1 hypothetical protein EGR_11013 [Echinococcus granulosus]